MKSLPLHHFHKNSGAVFKEIGEFSIPDHYGNVEEELLAINHHVALLDRSYLGKIALKGKDGIDLLNRISTNDLQYLSVGAMVDTVFTTPKGRLIDYCRVINTGEEIGLISSFMKAGHLIEWINRFIILEEAELRDISDIYCWMTLIGPKSKLALSQITGKVIPEREEIIWLKIEGESFPAFINKNFKVPAYNFCFPVKNAEKIAAFLVENINKLDGCIVGDNAFQIIRVESGMPDWGTEITQDYNPHEARLTNAISFTKGCYTGQEVIARLDTYDKVQKYLMIIELSEKISSLPPLDVFIEDEAIGHLTSYVFNPVSTRSVGLGYINKMYTTENSIYVEIFNGERRVPGKLFLPPQAFDEI